MGDLWTALDSNKDYATAKRLAIEFGKDFRLMDDLGWKAEDSRETVELTMPPDDLMEIIRRLGDEAQGGLATVEEERDAVAPPRIVENYRIAHEVCDEILVALAEKRGGAHG